MTLEHFKVEPTSVSDKCVFGNIGKTNWPCDAFTGNSSVFCIHESLMLLITYNGTMIEKYLAKHVVVGEIMDYGESQDWWV